MVSLRRLWAHAHNAYGTYRTFNPISDLLYPNLWTVKSCQIQKPRWLGAASGIVFLHAKQQFS